jgi:hypothetical protein
MARPSIYSDELLETICEKLSDGTPLAEMCREEGMPSPGTVRNWMNDEVEGVDGKRVSDAIARARIEGHDAIAARARLTARGKTIDEGGDSSGDVQRDKLIIETDLKLLAKWDPKRYGDKTLLGSDPDNPLPQNFSVNLVRPSQAD